MEEAYNRIATLLQRLIINQLPVGVGEEIIQKYLQYFMRILSSRMNPSIVEDEDQVRQLIQRKVLRSNNVENSGNKTQPTSQALRLQELFTRLNKLRVLKNKWSVLYLIHKISEFQETRSVSDVSALNSIFKTRELEKIPKNQQDTINNNSTMEIENTINTTQYNNATTTINNNIPSSATKFIYSSKSDKELQNLRILKRISNKGNAAINLTEADLIRDILYVFQGIEGQNIIYSKHEDSFSLKSTVPLATPVRKMVNSLCEMGWLFKKIQNYINQQNDKINGLINQSLCYGIKEELNEYYKLLAILENMRETEDTYIHTYIHTQQQQQQQQQQYQDDEPQKSLNLRKLYLWMSEPFERLKWLAVIVNSCQSLIGCSILSSVGTYAKQGSPIIKQLVLRVMKSILVPFLHYIQRWVYHGELNDILGEFFIKVNPLVPDELMWSDKYKLNISMIPTLLTQDIAEDILLIGKSVNFLRKSCQVHDWILQLDFVDVQSVLDAQQGESQGLTRFTEWVKTAASLTNKKLLEVMFTKFNFKQHSISIKKYLLLGQGDFLHCLMDQLHTELQKPAVMIFKHNLLSLLETAIRQSNAQYHDTNLLSRLDIKLLEPSAGDSGWDIFSLDYKIDMPISTILSPHLIQQYLKIFNFLWKVKRIEHSLSSIWISHMRSSHFLQQIKKHMHKYHLLRHEMQHFLSNFFNYIMVEVIESSWTQYIDGLTHVQNLNDLISIHEEFVQQILDKALLTPKYENLYKQIHKIFDTISKFKYMQDVLFSNALEEYQRKIVFNNEQTNNNMEIYDDDSQHPANLIMNSNNNNKDDMQTRISSDTFAQLNNTWRDYKDAFNNFNKTLNEIDFHGKLRFLAFRLDFNEYYKHHEHKKSYGKFDPDDFRIKTGILTYEPNTFRIQQQTNTQHLQQHTQFQNQQIMIDEGDSRDIEQEEQEEHEEHEGEHDDEYDQGDEL